MSYHTRNRKSFKQQLAYRVVSCPTCGAKPDDMCVVLHNLQATKLAHSAREIGSEEVVASATVTGGSALAFTIGVGFHAPVSRSAKPSQYTKQGQCRAVAQDPNGKDLVMKPMLAGKCTYTKQLRYPVLVSRKLDGVRALVINGQLLARSLKPIPNAYAQELFAHLPDGTDGELIVGDPTAPDAYRRTMSAVMSEDGAEPELRYHVFDNFNVTGPFEHRFSQVAKLQKHAHVSVVEHITVDDHEALDEFEAQALTDGYEGVMVRDPSGPYKHGRSTTNEGWLLKLKRFMDSEAVVTDAYEMMHNANAADVNELGHTHRSSHQEGMIPTGVLGGFEVRDTLSGVEFCIGTGFDAAERAKLWRTRKATIGRTLKYKYFPTGSKDKPRHPVFLGWRDVRDTSEG